MKNIINNIIYKKGNYKYVIAIIFLFLIFYIGIATIPSTIVESGNLLMGQGKSLRGNIGNFINELDNNYSGMLSFKGSFLHNKSTYINFNGCMANIMGQIQMNDRIKLKNGHLTYISEKQNGDMVINQMTKIYDKQKRNNKDFIFVLAPMQISKYEDILPDRFKSRDFTNQNADYVMERLTSSNISTLDLREVMLNEKIDHTSNFFATDHHWKPELGFWGYTKIVDYLINNKIISDIDFKYIDINQFNIKIYKNWFLGSHGKRTGKYFAGIDNFSIISPNFETNIHLEIKSRELIKEGSFEEVIFDKGQNRKDYFSSNPYAAYGYGDKDIIKYRNTLAPSNKKILLIGDSFSNVPFPFMSLISESVVQLDMRHFKENFKDYYEEYAPDIVIVLVNPHSIVGKNTEYDFFQDL